MSYEILQFNLGTGQAKAYTLHGLGEHDGTNLTISAADWAAMVQAEHSRLAGAGWSAPAARGGFLMPTEEQRAADAEQMRPLRQAVASRLDRMFLLRHAERSSIRYYAEQLGCDEAAAIRIRETAAAVELFARASMRQESECCRNALSE